MDIRRSKTIIKTVEDKLPITKSFKYLRLFLQKDEGVDRVVLHRIQFVFFVIIIYF